MLPTRVRSRNFGFSILSLSLLAGLGAAGCSPQDFEEFAGTVGDATPPAGMAIPFEEFNDDVGTRATSETRIVIKSAAGYQAVFGHAAPAGVDLGRQWVIFYAAGTKRTGGFDANIVSLTRLGDKLTAITELVSPGAGCAVTDALTSPNVLIKFAAQGNAAASFGKRDSVHDCEMPNPCAAVLCPVGSKCVVENVVCVRAPCPPRAVCQPDPTVTHCGGIAGIPCPSGQKCVDDPSDMCDPANGGADCGGICVGDPGVTHCGGFGGFPCPAGQMCIDDPSDMCDPANGGADCGGICVPGQTGTFCGGIAGIQCPAGQTCIDNPNDGCDPKNGGADCGGICVTQDPPPPKDPCAAVRCMAGTHCEAHDVVCVRAPCPPVAQCVPDAPKLFCGGIAGIPCPGIGRCVDDPSDSCDPAHGGADCGGMCQCIQNVACVAGTKFDSSPKVCTCVPQPPVCGPVCAIFCQYGHVLDAKGCPTCSCNPPPTPPATCPVEKCTGPRPASPTMMCADGSTAGPTCALNANGVCGWTVTTCPPPKG